MLGTNRHVHSRNLQEPDMWKFQMDYGCIQQCNIYSRIYVAGSTCPWLGSTSLVDSIIWEESVSSADSQIDDQVKLWWINKNFKLRWFLNLFLFENYYRTSSSKGAILVANRHGFSISAGNAPVETPKSQNPPAPGVIRPVSTSSMLNFK